MFSEISLTWRPLFPVIWLLLWLAAGVVLMVFQWHGGDAAVRRSYRLCLQGMRLLGLLLLFVWLARPVVIRRQPEAGAFRVAVLADQSRSMDQVDAGADRSRRQILSELLSVPSMKKLSASGEVEYWGFSEEIRPLADPLSGAVLPVLPGATGLGDALSRAATGRLGARPLGAMLVFSDGRWNEGQSPTEAAKALALQKIPVSCVGIGAAGTPEDVRIRFVQEGTGTAEKNQPYQVEAVVRNDFGRIQDLKIRLFENGQPVAEQPLRLQPHSEQRIRFQHRSLLAGMRSLAVKAEVPSGDLKPENNADYLPMEIHEPDRFRILYLSNAMHWEWRFLKINGENQGQLEMAAIIRTAPKQFFHWGLKAEAAAELKGFPENTEIYADFDAVLAEASALWQMSPAAQEALAAFVEYKGGGLLITGMKSGEKQFLPECIRKICPVYQGEQQKMPGDRYLEITDPMIFQTDGSNFLHTARGIPWYAGIPFTACTGIKKAARVLMEMRSGSPVMVAQSYGAGRCVYLGLQQTWQWRMREEQAVYEEFWNQLLVWLAASRTAPLELLNQNCKVPVDVLHELAVRVSGSDFLPAPDAVVTASVTGPDGRLTELSLYPSLDEIGHYSASFRPETAGEYSLRYQVRLADGRTREASASLLAVLSGREVRNVDYHEEVLRDIARITGGKFYAAGAFPRKQLVLPLSEKLPMTETSVPLLDSWWMLLLMGAVWTAHWWMRRRIGLK